MRKPFALLITDIHFDIDNLHEVTDIHIQLFKLCRKLNVNVIFCLGDVFTDRIGQNLWVLLAFRNVLKILEESGIEIYFIPGNHDKTDQEAEESYLDIYEKYDNVHIISKETSILFQDKFLISFLPYFKENGSYPSRLKIVARNGEKYPKKPHFLMTHIAVQGVKNNDGSEVKEEGIKKSSFNTFDKVFVGHYHNASKVGNNIYYIGSALPQRHGEDDQKGFTILYNDGSHELHKANFKSYVKVVVDLAKVDKKELTKIKNELAVSGNNNRIVFKGTEEQLSSINKIEYSSLGIDIKTESKNIMKSITAAENDEFIEYDKKTIMKCFLEFCSVNEFDPSNRTDGFQYLKKI